MDPYQTTLRLPGDLFPEILSRLPVKSLLRFRCVSKPWLALVDDDANFPRLHLTNFKNNRDETRHLVVREKECEVRCSDTFEPIPKILPPSETFHPNNWKIIYSIDGLVLLRSSTCRFNQFHDLKVWNPSIGKSRDIPPLPLQQVSPYSILWDKNVSLGYDSVAKDHKLVKPFFANNRNLHSVAVYAIGSGPWKIINFQSSGWHWDASEFNKAVYFQSKLYFIVWHKSLLRLVWFDLNKEEFSSIILFDDPSLWSSHFYCWRLVSIDDGGLTLQTRYEDSTYVYVWEVDAEFMCLNKPQFYSLKGSRKSGDMQTLWTYSGKVIGGNGKEKWVERKILEDLFRPPDVPCYVESLYLHR